MFLRSLRRRHIRRRTFPDHWRRFLIDNVPLYARLSPADRDELHAHILVFLHEKRFEGCAGFRITDQVRLTIASQACLLLLHRPTGYFPRLVTVLVYPRSYVARNVKRSHGPLVIEADESRAGEAWAEGTVVLSWEDVIASRDPGQRGYNVVLHEFAHELDQEFGITRAVEDLPHASRRGRDWRSVLKSEYDALRHNLDHHLPTFLDDYAGTNPAEFFAVLTEAFFETPTELQSHHPDLYPLLVEFYHLDPVQTLRPSWPYA